MNAAFLFSSLDFGGAQKNLCFVIKSVSCCFDHIFIILKDNKKIDYILPTNSSIIQLKSGKRNGPINKIIDFRKTVKSVKRIIEDNDISILCGFGVFFSTIVYYATKKTKCKSLVSERRSPINLGLFWRIISKIVYKKCDCIVFQLEGARSFYKHIDYKKTRIIPNPFFSNDGLIREPIPFNLRDKKIIMAAARIEDVKGFDVGLKAMSIILEKHPEFSMDVYGNGDFDGKYSGLIKELNIGEKIIFKGLSQNLIEDISNAQFFLLPSRFEGIPNVLMEAMSCGLVCVATDCPPGGPKFLFDNEKNGLLVPVDDFDAMGKCVVSLINNEKKCIDISYNAALIKERFREDKIGKAWAEAFLSVCTNEL